MMRFPRCIMTTCCVPWDANGTLLESIFRRGVQRWLTFTPHLYVFGTAGEGYGVTESQFDAIVTAFVDEMRQGNAEPMVGVIHLSLGTILERIQRWHDRGVSLFQFSLPGWGTLSDLEVLTFFDRVCGSFPDCRFMHYNLPRVGRLITGQEYGVLAESHPNLVATKNTGDSLTHINSLLEHAPQLQHFLSETGYAHGSLIGECSLLASLTMGWSRLQALFEAGIRRDLPEVVSIQREVALVLQTLWETVPKGRMDGAYDKLFVKMFDPEFPLRLLPPYSGSTEKEFDTFVDRLKECLPDWLPPASECA